MKVTPDIIREEFIGTHGLISTSSPHAGYLGISGRSNGRNKKYLRDSAEGKMKSIVKDQSVFQFQFSDGTVVEIDGKLLVGKPEDRLKKTVKRLW